jgi:hypothetical protein
MARTVMFLESDAKLWIYVKILIEKYFKEFEAAVTAHRRSISDNQLFHSNSCCNVKARSVWSCRYVSIMKKARECGVLPPWIFSQQMDYTAVFTSSRTSSPPRHVTLNGSFAGEAINFSVTRQHPSLHHSYVIMYAFTVCLCNWFLSIFQFFSFYIFMF